MADFELQLDVVAQTAKLEQGLKKAEAEVSRSAKKMDKTIAESKGNGGEHLGKKVGSDFLNGLVSMAGAAALTQVIGGALRETATQLKGESEESGRSIGMALAEGAMSAWQAIPIFGDITTITGALVGAFDFNKLQKERARIAEQQAAVERRRVKLLQVELDYQEQLRKEEQDRLEAARAAEEEMRRRNREILDFNRRMEDMQFDLQTRIELANASQDEERQAQIRREAERRRFIEDLDRQIKDLMDAERFFEAEQIRRDRSRLIALFDQAQQAERAAEARRAEAEAEQDAAEKAAMAQEEAMRSQLELAEKRKNIEREIAEARAEAERQVAGATATFSTAGGSFTAAASAQVNEAKLLTRISQQSRDFLAQIVANTMSLPGALSLG